MKGMVIAASMDRVDPWQTRQAIALVFRHLAPSLPDAIISPFFDFIIKGATRQ